MQLLKKSFILSLLCMAAAIIIVLILMFISPGGRLQKNSFKRKFISKALVSLYHSEKITGLRAICGIQNNHIYFETDTVGNIIETDFTLSNARILKFEIPGGINVASLYTTFIDSPYCYITAGNVPAIIRFNIKELPYQLFHFPGRLFSEAVLAANGNFILRVYQKSVGKWDQVFTSWNPVKNTFLTEENITEKRGDAGFSTDGMLLFDKGKSRILYVAYYSNQFICMDTLLHVLYKGRTIDTFSNVTVKVWSKSTRYSKTITNVSPLNLINLESKAVNGKLYVHSAIRADNEKSKEFTHQAVIDMYQISDGHYFGSFYIPKYNEERLKDFEVTGDKIIALYHNYIIVYSTPFHL